MMKQVLFSFLWIVAGVVLGLSIMSFDTLFCFESRLDWRTVGFLMAIILTEGLIFPLSAKTETFSASMFSLIVCLALVGFGIEVSGLEHIDFTATAKFSELVYHKPWYKIFILMLFVLPLIFWAYHTLKHRKGKLKKRKPNQKVEDRL